MPRPPRPLPDALAGRAFTPDQAADAGLTRGRLRRPDISHPHRGVFAYGTATDLRARCRAALPLLGPRRCFSHLTAARLWGLPLPFEWTPDEPLHILTLAGAEPVRRPGIVGWESGRATVVSLRDGLPLVAVAAAWAQLSVPGALGHDEWSGRRRALRDEWLVAVADHLVTGPHRAGRRVPMCTVDELDMAVRVHRGRRGAKALTRARARVRVGAQSPRETLLRLALVDRGLPEPVVQPPIATAAGIRHPDLGYVAERILIEYHGDHHRTDARQWREDLTRRQLFEDAGWRVVEVGADVFDDGCLALATRLRRALARDPAKPRLWSDQAR